MVMLNVPAELAAQLRAYAKEHDVDDVTALEILLREEAARRKRLEDWKELGELAGTIEYEDHGPR